MSRRDPRARLREWPAWRVRIPAHTIERTGLGGRPTGGVYEIPERVSVRFETSREAAVEFAVRAVHIEFGIPPVMPYFRQTERIARVERCTWHPETASAV